jgi:cutinase
MPHNMKFLVLATLLPVIVSGAPIAARQTTLINMILAGVGKLPGVGQSIDAISGVLTKFEATLATTLKVDTTEDNTACAAMTVIFARGTTEPGNVGLVTGPPFFDAIQAMMGSKAVAVQGVNYPASIEGFLQGGDAAGSQTM